MQSPKRTHIKTLGGFSLLELLVVIGILGIISVIAYVSFGGATDKAYNTRVVSDVNAAEGALQMIKVESGSLPEPGEYNSGSNVWGYSGGVTAQASNTYDLVYAGNEVLSLSGTAGGGGDILSIETDTASGELIGKKGTITDLGKKYLSKDVYDPKIGDIVLKNDDNSKKKLIDYGIGRYSYGVYGPSGQTSYSYYTLAGTTKNTDTGNYESYIVGNYDPSICLDPSTCPSTLIGSGTGALKPNTPGNNGGNSNGGGSSGSNGSNPGGNTTNPNNPTPYNPPSPPTPNPGGSSGGNSSGGDQTPDPDEEDEEYTPGSCFEFDSSTNTITGYKDADNDGNPCPKDVKIPNTIAGTEVKHIGENAFYDKELTFISIPASVTYIGEKAFMRNKLDTIVFHGIAPILLDDNIFSLQYPIRETQDFSFISYTRGTYKLIQGSKFWKWERQSPNPDNPPPLRRSGHFNMPTTTTNQNIILYLGCPMSDVFGQHDILVAYGDNPGPTNWRPCPIGVGIGYVLSSELGQKTVYVRFKDKAGNMTQSISRTIELISPPTSTPISCFTFNPNTKTINGYKNTDSLGDPCPKDVVIPPDIDGVPVQYIGSIAFGSKGIQSVVLPEGIIGIGNQAFSNNSITSINLPSSVKTLGPWAFNSNRIFNIDIPKSVTEIGGGAFNGNLLPENQALIYKRNSDGTQDRSTLVSYGGKSSILVLPSNIEHLGKYSLYGIPGLRNVILPSNLKTIGSSVSLFNRIPYLNIPYGVTSIGTGAFVNSGIMELHIPNSVTNIGAIAFNDNQLSDSKAFIHQRNGDGSIDPTTLISYGGENKTPVIPNGVESIGTSAFNYTYITGITIPNSVISIGDSVFSQNNLTSVTIPESVTSIGDAAFLSNGPNRNSDDLPRGTPNGWIPGNTSTWSVVGKDWIKQP